MTERVPNTFEGTNLIEDAVTMFIGGKVYEGWTDVKLTRELNVLAASFEVGAIDRWAADMAQWTIKGGDAVHLHIGKTSVFTGYVDKVSPSFGPSAHKIAVSGRSKTADLVDCSVEEGNQYSGLTLTDIAKKICKPFGVSVIALADVGAAFSNVVIQPGETCFALLDRLARQRKVLMYPSADGALVITSVGTVRAKTELHQGVNIISASADHDFANRFSKYTVKGQNLGWLGAPAQSVASTGTATDSGVGRYRPLVLLAEQTVDDAAGDNRAAYECDLRAAKSLTASVTVPGWRQQDGSLWDINQLVFLDSGKLGIRRKMLIEKVEFTKGSGTTTTLSLIREDAYGFKKTVKKEDPLAWTKFIK